LAARPLGALAAFAGCATTLGVLFLTRPARIRVPEQQGHDPDVAILLASRRLMRGGLAVLSIVSRWGVCCAVVCLVLKMGYLYRNSLHENMRIKKGVNVPMGTARSEIVSFRWKDYHLITNEPWFVRSPIEASVISIQKTGDEGQEVRQEPVPAPPQGSRALLCVE
jgi:hypothetical protein